jgi:hypothetical protein
LPQCRETTPSATCLRESRTGIRLLPPKSASHCTLFASPQQACNPPTHLIELTNHSITSSLLWYERSQAHLDIHCKSDAELGTRRGHPCVMQQTSNHSRVTHIASPGPSSSASTPTHPRTLALLHLDRLIPYPLVLPQCTRRVRRLRWHVEGRRGDTRAAEPTGGRGPVADIQGVSATPQHARSISNARTHNHSPHTLPA